MELARAYAALIDQDEGTLRTVGRAFQKTLAELGLTPRTRAALPQGETQPPTPSPLEELRARRERRLALYAAPQAPGRDRQQPPEASRGGEC